MKNASYLEIVPIFSRVHRKQNKMTCLCITLSVFLVAVMFGLADLYLQGVVKKEMQEKGIQGQFAGAGVKQIYLVAFWLSLIVMLTCILMISSSLNTNVMQRTQFFGLLRCQGATKKQVMRLVRCEALHWCRRAIPAGAALSVIIVWILSAVMRRVSPQRFSCMPVFGISWISVAVSMLLGLITVLLASRAPGKRASKVTPLEAAAGDKKQTMSFQKGANTRFFKIETGLGIHHALENKKNYFLMTGAFAVCIVLFLTFSTLVDFMKNAFMPPKWTPELSVASETNTCSIDPGLLDKILQMDSVKRAYGRMFAYEVPVLFGEKSYRANVISYEENQFAWAEESLLEGSADEVMNGENKVLAVVSENTEFAAGDTVVLKVGGRTHTVTVAGILSESPLAREENTETFFCSEETFSGLTGKEGYTIIDIQFKNWAGPEEISEAEDLFVEGGVTFHDQLSKVRQQRNLYYAFSVLVYGFLTVILAITVFHILNVIQMGAAAKMKQYGVMRAVGMSTRQVVKMIAAEAGAYAVSGVAIGCMAGIPAHWVVFVSLITNFWGIPWSIPIRTLGQIAAIVLITALLSVWGPARRLKRMSVVSTIHAE
ncbi:MAG TPA: FtsX-like permease family protein [Candidatus Choladousia intestinigallinarum]|nr:FtsX-like permease family protein [Candidatus Choladousia intestinigallinarum]